MLRQSALLSLCELKLHGSFMLYLLYDLSKVYSYHIPRFSYRTFVFACPYRRQGATNGCVLICDQLLNDVFYFKVLLETLEAICSPKVYIFHHIIVFHNSLCRFYRTFIINQLLSVNYIFYLIEKHSYTCCVLCQCVYLNI